MLLSREKLLKRGQLAIEKVDLDKESFVYVTEMTGKQKELWERSLINESAIMQGSKKGNQAPTVKLDDFKAKLAVMTICDEKGELQLKPADAHTLNESIKASWLEKIVEAAQRLNKITEEDREELVKN